MGCVYLAKQENPSRIVALKVIKPGFVNAELLRRFEQEADALGRLQHPGIAQIYEAGTADSGFGPQLYFAMEFIEGRNAVDTPEACLDAFLENYTFSRISRRTTILFVGPAESPCLSQN